MSVLPALADGFSRARITRVMKKLAAECLGTVTLVFAGTGAIVINDLSGGSVSHVGIALTFGLVVLAMISGASMNPARSLAPTLVSMRFEGLWIFLTAPVFGAVLAVFACRLVHQEGCCSAVEEQCL